MQYRESIERAIELAQSGERQRAIEMLDELLTDARIAADSAWIAQLAKAAAVIVEDLGDMSRVATYYREARDSDASDPYLRLALGKVLIELGQPSEAAVELSAGLELARAHQEPELVNVISRMLADSRR